MDQGNKKNGLILIVVLATIFGLAGGVVGELIGSSYAINRAYSPPFFNEINLSNGAYRGQNIIIKEPKNVVVEQSDKAAETINSAGASLVGIFKKQPVGPAGAFNQNNYYNLKKAAAGGLIITSDGWIVTSFPFSATADRESDLNNYVVITKDKKIYSLDKIIKDKFSQFSFLRVKAKDFSVKRFVEAAEIKNGQAVLAVNWSGAGWLNSIADSQSKPGDPINFSDAFSSEIKLTAKPDEEFNGAILFNLGGGVVGLIDQEGGIQPITHFASTILSLLKEQMVRRPSLGVYYVDLSDWLSAGAKEDSEEAEQNDRSNGALIAKGPKGIAVVKGGAADLAGLKAGDIIVAVNNVKINQDNDLAEVIGSFMAGDKVTIAYWRGGEKSEAEVKLGEAK